MGQWGAYLPTYLHTQKTRTITFSQPHRIDNPRPFRFRPTDAEVLFRLIYREISREILPHLYARKKIRLRNLTR